MSELETRPISGNDVRLPDPERGVAVVAERYGRRRAVVLHPEDFDELVETAARDARRRAAASSMRLTRLAAATQRRDDDEDYDLDDIPLATER